DGDLAGQPRAQVDEEAHHEGRETDEHPRERDERAFGPPLQNASPIVRWNAPGKRTNPRLIWLCGRQRSPRVVLHGTGSEPSVPMTCSSSGRTATSKRKGPMMVR